MASHASLCFVALCLLFGTLAFACDGDTPYACGSTCTASCSLLMLDSTNTINVGEVEVFAKNGSQVTAVDVESDSTYSGAVFGTRWARFAIDGKTNTFQATNAPKGNATAWLKVWFPILSDLIGDVVVHNRKDCCNTRLQDANMTLYDGGNNTGDGLWTVSFETRKAAYTFTPNYTRPSPSPEPLESEFPTVPVVIAVGVAAAAAVGAAGVAACCCGKCACIGIGVGAGATGAAVGGGVLVVLSQKSGLKKRMAEGAEPVGVALSDDLLQAPANCPGVVKFLRGLPARFTKASVNQLIEALDPFVEAHPPPKNGAVTEEDVKAMYVYTYELKVIGDDGAPTEESIDSQIYGEMNRAMRTGTGVKAWHPLIYLVSTALQRLPEQKATVYRGLENVTLDFAANDTVMWSQFSSTSLRKAVAQDFMKQGNGTIFIIQSRSGVSVGPWSDFPEEAELVLPPNVKFVVTGVTRKGSCNVIKMREIGDTPAGPGSFFDLC